MKEPYTPVPIIISDTLEKLVYELYSRAHSKFGSSGDHVESSLQKISGFPLRWYPALHVYVLTLPIALGPLPHSARGKTGGAGQAEM